MSRNAIQVQDGRREELGDGPKFEAALELLLCAFDEAVQESLAAWAVPVTRETLRGAGLTDEALRRLLDRGVVVQRLEDFVLTEEGARWVRGLWSNSTAVVGVARAEVREAVPVYDKDRRELWFKGRLVKRLRQPAGNQELILLAFQEQGWPDAIDDPLPGNADQDRQERLHNAIRRLNKHQHEATILFRRNGSGSRILWQAGD
jgi:hypothetical protein